MAYRLVYVCVDLARPMLTPRGGGLSWTACWMWSVHVLAGRSRGNELLGMPAGLLAGPGQFGVVTGEIDPSGGGAGKLHGRGRGGRPRRTSAIAHGCSRHYHDSIHRHRSL